MEYQSMTRKQLQSLCKKYGIPANTTNALMAESLAALLSSSAMEHERSAKECDAKSSESEASKESDNAEKETMLTTPAVGNRRASTRKLPISTCKKVVRSTRKSASAMKEESDISEITQEQSLLKNSKKTGQGWEEDLKAELKDGGTRRKQGDGASSIDTENSAEKTAEVNNVVVHQSLNETELGVTKQMRGRRGDPLKATAVANSQKESGNRSTRSKTPSKAVMVLAISDEEEVEEEEDKNKEEDERDGKDDIGMDFQTPASAFRNNLLGYSSMKTRKDESRVGDGRIDLEANLYTPAMAGRGESKLSEVLTNPSIRRSSRRAGGGVSVSNSTTTSSSVKQKQESVAVSVRMSARRRRPADSVDPCIPKDPSVSDNEGDVEDNCNEKASEKIVNTDGRRRSARGKPPMNGDSSLKGRSERELTTIDKKTPYGRRITKASTKKGSVSTASELKKSVNFALDMEERVPYELDVLLAGNPTEKEPLSSSNEADTATLSLASEEGCLDSILVNGGEFNGAPMKDDAAVEVNPTGKEASSSSNEVDIATLSMASLEVLDSALVITGGEFNEVPSKEDVVVKVIQMEKETSPSSKEVDDMIPSMASVDGLVSILVNEVEFDGAPSEYDVVVESLPSPKEVSSLIPPTVSVEGLDSALVNEGDSSGVPSMDNEVVMVVNPVEKEVLGSSNEDDIAIPAISSSAEEQFEGENEEQFVPHEDSGPSKNGVDSDKPSMDCRKTEGSKDSAVVNQREEGEDKEEEVTEIGNAILSMVKVIPDQMPSMLPSLFEGENEEQFAPNEEPVQESGGNKDFAVVVGQIAMEGESLANNSSTATPSMVCCGLNTSNLPIKGEMDEVQSSQLANEKKEGIVEVDEVAPICLSIPSCMFEEQSEAMGEEESLANNSGTAIPTMVSCGLYTSNLPIEGEMDEENGNKEGAVEVDEGAPICLSIPSHMSEEQSEAMVEVPCQLEEKGETSISFIAIEITEQVLPSEEEKVMENMAMSAMEETNVDTESEEILFSKEDLSEAMVEKKANSERQKEMDFACLSLRKLRALCKQKGGRLPHSSTQSNNAIAVMKPSEILSMETMPPCANTEKMKTNIDIELPTLDLKVSSTTENNYTKQTVSSSAKKNNKGFELSAKKTPSSISSSKRTPLQLLSSNVAQKSLSTNLLAAFENGGSSPCLARSDDSNRFPR